MFCNDLSKNCRNIKKEGKQYLTIFPVLLILLFGNTVVAGLFPSYVYCITPSIGIGYEFGKKPGFIVGGDVGMMVYGNTSGFWWTGINIGFENNLKQHTWSTKQEIVGGYLFAGLGIGVNQKNDQILISNRLIANGYLGNISYQLPLFGLSEKVFACGQFPIEFKTVY